MLVCVCVCVCVCLCVCVRERKSVCVCVLETVDKKEKVFIWQTITDSLIFCLTYTKHNRSLKLYKALPSSQSDPCPHCNLIESLVVVVVVSSNKGRVILNQVVHHSFTFRRKETKKIHFNQKSRFARE